MASVFKRKGSRNWYASWFDHEGGRPERSTGTTDKRLAERLAQRWEDEAIARREGLVDVRAEALADAESRPIQEHLSAFIKYLEDKGTGPKAVDAVETRVKRILELGRVGRIGELRPSAVLSAIQQMRGPGVVTFAGLSSRTASHYLVSVKGFSRWLVREKLAAADELAHLRGFNAASDRRRVRRDLEPDEVSRIIAAAEASPTVEVPKRERRASGEVRVTMNRMHQPDRAWAYRIAAQTGFRVAEISSLTPDSFELDTEPPCIRCKAGSTKNGKEAVQPIRDDFAEMLRPWLAGKPDNVPVCPIPEGKAALLLRADMEAAWARWLEEAPSPAERKHRENSDFLRHTDAAGRVADFHGLRVHYISRVVAAGANLKQAMELARHSDPKLTLGTYAKVGLASLSGVLSRVPSVATPTEPHPQRAVATGTFGPIPETESRRQTPPHQSPQTSHRIMRDDATVCDDEDVENRATACLKPLQVGPLCEGVQRRASARENAPGQIRTADLRFRKPPLYPTELRAHTQQ